MSRFKKKKMINLPTLPIFRPSRTWQYCSTANNTGIQICSSVVQYLHSNIWDLKYPFSQKHPVNPKYKQLKKKFSLTSTSRPSLADTPCTLNANPNPRWISNAEWLPVATEGTVTVLPVSPSLIPSPPPPPSPGTGVTTSPSADCRTRDGNEMASFSSELPPSRPGLDNLPSLLSPLSPMQRRSSGLRRYDGPCLAFSYTNKSNVQINPYLSAGLLACKWTVRRKYEKKNNTLRSPEH